MLRKYFDSGGMFVFWSQRLKQKDKKNKCEKMDLFLFIVYLYLGIQINQVDDKITRRLGGGFLSFHSSFVC